MEIIKRVSYYNDYQEVESDLTKSFIELAPLSEVTNDPIKRKPIKIPPAENETVALATCSLNVANAKIVIVENGKDIARKFSAKVGSKVL